VSSVSHPFQQPPSPSEVTVELTILLFNRFGSFAPVLILFLRSLNIPDERVGLFLSATLAGDVLVSLFVTWSADALGRRRMMALGSILMAGSGVSFPFSVFRAFYCPLRVRTESHLSSTARILLLLKLPRPPRRRYRRHHLPERE
jgi:MFS family permease